jgi:hypothetical protein
MTTGDDRHREMDEALDLYGKNLDPETKALVNHPAVRQYMKAMRDCPDAFPHPASFRTIIKDYEEQQALAEKIRKEFAWLAENPPLKQTKMPQELSSLTYELKPKSKLGRKANLKINIQIPATTGAHARERLLFKTTQIVDEQFQGRDEFPPTSEIKSYFERSILAELKELHINVFRFQIFEPERENSAPKPPLI